MSERSIEIAVENQTDQVLQLSSWSSEDAQFERSQKWNPAPISIEAKGTMTCKCQTAGWGIANEINGNARWTFGNDSWLQISFSKPTGFGSTSVDHSCSGGYYTSLEGELGGHHTTMRVIIKSS